MKQFKVSQKILAIGATYEVFEGSDTTPKMVVKGKILTIKPKLEVVQDGLTVATMTGNIFGTRFEITDASGTVQGTLQYPFFAFLKSFKLIIGEKEYVAKGGLIGRKFSCEDTDGTIMVGVSKEMSLKDKFDVSVNDSIPEIVGVLAAVSIDQRFFQN